MKFETGVPIPDPVVKTGRPSSGWAQMAVGQSVFFPGKKYKHAKSVASYLKRRYGFECTARSVEGGSRLWRTG